MNPQLFEKVMNVATSRIQLHDTVVEMITKMAEGNPGAVNVLCGLLQHNAYVDPISAMGPFSTVLSLDTEGIYGSRIWVLFKDVCGQSIVHLIALMRGVQMGIIPRAEVFNPGRNFADLVWQLQERLGKFNATIELPPSPSPAMEERNEEKKGGCE